MNDRHIINYQLHYGVIENERIQLSLVKAEEELNRWLIDTREKAIEECLIKLGWTPPDRKNQIV